MVVQNMDPPLAKLNYFKGDIVVENCASLRNLEVPFQTKTFY